MININSLRKFVWRRLVEGPFQKDYKEALKERLGSLIYDIKMHVDSTSTPPLYTVTRRRKVSISAEDLRETYGKVMNMRMRI